MPKGNAGSQAAREAAFAGAIAQGEGGGGMVGPGAAATPSAGAASVSVRGERVPLTPEGLAKARCGAAAVGRELADGLRRRLDID